MTRLDWLVLMALLRRGRAVVGEVTATTPAVAGRPEVGLEAAGNMLAEAAEWVVGRVEDGAIEYARRDVPRLRLAMRAWYEAAHAHRAAQRQAADDEAAYAANRED